MMTKRISYTIIALAMGLAMTSCEKKGADATGVFEAKTVNISAETSGAILSFNVKEGDDVKAGQLLVVVDTLQYDIQRSQLLTAGETISTSVVNADSQTAALKVQLNQLEKEKKRVENLLAVGAATKQQQEELDTKIAAVRNQIAAAKESISLTNNSTKGQGKSTDIQLRGINELIKRCYIRAPFDGKIATTYANAREVTAAGHPLLQIIDNNDTYLRAYFPGSKIGSIRVGQKVKVKTLYGGADEKEYEGKITWIASEGEFTPKSIPSSDERANILYATKIAVKNDGNIRLGLTGEVYLNEQ